MSKPKQTLVQVLPNGKVQDHVDIIHYPQKILSGNIKLQNKQNTIVAFKMRTNDPKHLSLKPSVGYIQPQGSIILQLQLQNIFENSKQIIKPKLELLVIAIEGQNSQAPVDASQLFAKKTSETPIQSQQILIYLKEPDQNTDQMNNSNLNPSMSVNSTDALQKKSSEQEIQTGFLKEQIYSVKQGHNLTIPELSQSQKSSTQSQSQQDIFSSTSNQFQSQKEQQQKQQNASEINKVIKEEPYQENDKNQKQQQQEEEEEIYVNPKQKYEQLKSDLNIFKTQTSYYQAQISELEKSIKLKNLTLDAHNKEIAELKQQGRPKLSVFSYILAILAFLLGLYIGGFIKPVIQNNNSNSEQIKTEI